MIDTHSHLYAPEFDADRTEVLLRAREAGVSHILLPNINRESVGPMLRLCREAPGYCFPMMGLHPEDVREDYAEVLGHMRTRLGEKGHPYVAVGEVGLDFYWDTTYAREQLVAFREQVGWALEFGLPLVIHTRSAHRELVDALRQFPADKLSGVFHCFGGTLEEAQELLDTFPHFCLGIGGVLTYKKSKLPEVVRLLPLERIVLETDAPYLSPVPYRGRRNESAYVLATAQCLAATLNTSLEEIDSTTSGNVRRLFPKVFA